MSGAEFHPKVAVTKEDLAKMLERAKPSNLVKLGAQILETDSEDGEHDHLAAHAIDGDPDTFWHTRWQPRNDPLPHHLTIDLGREVTLRGMTYLPRQDMANGRIASAEILLSNDPRSWGDPVAKANWRNSDQRQTVEFTQPVTARYLKFVVTSEVNQNPFAAVAELDVLLDNTTATFFTYASLDFHGK